MQKFEYLLLLHLLIKMSRSIFTSSKVIFYGPCNRCKKSVESKTSYCPHCTDLILLCSNLCVNEHIKFNHEKSKVPKCHGCGSYILYNKRYCPECKPPRLFCCDLCVQGHIYTGHPNLVIKEMVKINGHNVEAEIYPEIPHQKCPSCDHLIHQGRSMYICTKCKLGICSRKCLEEHKNGTMHLRKIL